MIEFKNKSDYSCIFFFDERKPVKYEFVDNVFSICQYVKLKIGIFKYVNVYVRRSGRYLMRCMPDQFIPTKPR